MEHETSAKKPVPGQADQLDRGAQTTSNGDDAPRGSGAPEKRVDDELQRPPEDRSPLT